jgi:uncharacterized membrane protein (UPF0127 family)
MHSTVTNDTFMLFYLGEPGIYSFWMKDTYAPLDIIWLNYSSSTGIAKVVYVVDAPPCVNYDTYQSNCIVYMPTNNSNYVIETRGGFTESNNISIGNHIMFIYK